MIKIKFNDSTEFIENVYYQQTGDYVCKIIGKNVPQNTSGFHTYLPNGEHLGNRSLYTTVYKVDEDGVWFSSDYSVYKEPEPVEEIIPEPVDVPYTPSLEERVSDLEDAVIELSEMVGE